MKRLICIILFFFNEEYVISQSVFFYHDINKNVISKSFNNSENIVNNKLNNGIGSLRHTILNACPEDTILFSENLINDTISLVHPELIIDRNLYILGLGMNNLTVSGNNLTRIFNIMPNILVGIENLKLIDGYSTTLGGAIYNQSDLLLKNVIFQNNAEGTNPKPFTSSGTIEVQGQVILKE